VPLDALPSFPRLLDRVQRSLPETARRKKVCVKSWLPWRWLFAPVHRLPKQERTTEVIHTTGSIRMAAGRRLGAAGTCAPRSVAILARSTISPAPGRITVAMLAVRRSGPSSCGLTMSGKSLGTRMANGLSRAAMTVTPFGPVRGHWRGPSRSGRHSQRFNLKNGPGENRGRFFRKCSGAQKALHARLRRHTADTSA
jgi:hypothetical protein